MKSTLIALAGAGVSQALHVTQWQDSMTILPGHYIELYNQNRESFLAEAVDNKTQLQ